jgi:hypothetical protein
VVRELALRVEAPVADVLERCAGHGVAAGYPLARDYPEHADGILVALTERTGRREIDRLAEVLEEAVADANGTGPGRRVAGGGKLSDRHAEEAIGR